MEGSVPSGGHVVNHRRRGGRKENVPPFVMSYVLIGLSHVWELKGTVRPKLKCYTLASKEALLTFF